MHGNHEQHSVPENIKIANRNIPKRNTNLRPNFYSNDVRNHPEFHRDNVNSQYGEQNHRTLLANETSIHRGEDSLTTRDFAKAAANVERSYKQENKYEGTGDNFAFKIMIFKDLCRRMDLPPSQYMRAFPAMLNSIALSHYHSSNLADMNFEDAVHIIRTLCEGEDYSDLAQSKWNEVSLASIIEENQSKSVTECFKLLNTTLGELRTELPPELQTVAFMRSKTMLACTGVEHCRATFANPPKDLGNLISSFANSIRAKEAVEKIEKTPSTFWTDRKFHRNYNNQSGPSHDNILHRPKCYVCGKEECRSWKHNSEREKEAARNRHASNRRFLKFDRSSPRFKKRFRQWLCQYEGDADEDDYENAFAINTFPDEAIVNSNHPEDLQDEPLDSHYFTSFGKINNMEAEKTTSALIENSFLHSICPKLTERVKDYKSTDTISYDYNTFIHNLNPEPEPAAAFASMLNRYGIDIFAGLLIDTGAAKYSSVGIAQMSVLQKLSPDITIHNLDKKEEWRVYFGIVKSISKQRANIHTAIGPIVFYIFETATSFLICLADLQKCGFYLNNLTYTLNNADGSREIPVINRWGHFFLPYMPKLATYITDAIESED
ncbi:hypothetical protein EV44_g6373 [Erysiphe necator]|uniref:Uncharacterized protein n=1 Tax=Uncinula necator TaxID=52586 RepID=A0A0B1PCJ5_UNCNE|nr:hypothetical protein EV44_g6373 [Erysiphe necator]